VLLAGSIYEALYQPQHKEEPFELPSLFDRRLTGGHWLDIWLALADTGPYNPILAGIGSALRSLGAAKLL
jgi:hypothetical protein